MKEFHGASSTLSGAGLKNHRGGLMDDSIVWERKKGPGNIKMLIEWLLRETYHIMGRPSVIDLAKYDNR